MEKIKMQNKSIVFLCTLFIVIFCILMILSTYSFSSFTDEKSEEAIALDFKNVVMKAELLYDYNSDGAKNCIDELKNIKKYNNVLTDEQILDSLKLNFQYYQSRANRVVLDIECYRNDIKFSAVTQQKRDCPIPNELADCLANPNTLLESDVYLHNDTKAFAYYMYDTSLDLTIAIVINAKELALYDMTYSTYDMHLSLIRPDGYIIASKNEAMIGENINTFYHPDWDLFRAWIPEIVANPYQTLTKLTEELSLTYYIEEADRIILGLYYEPHTFKTYGYVFVAATGALVVVCGIILTRLVIKTINKNRKLNDKLFETQLEKVEQTQFVENLCEVVEYRSQESGTHVKRIKGYSKILAHNLMEEYPEYNLTEEKCALIAAASSLHDIGKITVSDMILNKPGKLTSEERSEMEKHTIKGAEMIDKIFKKRNNYYQIAYNIALSHHERYDGGGYPNKLSGDNIPIEAQIISIIDCFDALVNDRCYKKAVSIEKAYEMILNGECGSFNPKIIEIFKKSKYEIIDTYNKYKEYGFML